MVVIPYPLTNADPVAIYEAVFLLLQRTDAYFSQMEDISGVFTLSDWNNPAPSNVVTDADPTQTYPNFWIEPLNQTKRRESFAPTDMAISENVSLLPSFLANVGTPSPIYAGWRVVIGSFTENKIYIQAEIYPSTQPDSATYTPQAWPAMNTAPIIAEFSSPTKPNGDLFADISRFFRGYCKNIAEFHDWDSGQAYRYMRMTSIRLYHKEYVPPSLVSYMTASPADYEPAIEDVVSAGYPQLESLPMAIPDTLVTEGITRAMLDRPFASSYTMSVAGGSTLEGKWMAMQEGTAMYWAPANNGASGYPFTAVLNWGRGNETMYLNFSDFAETAWAANQAFPTTECTQIEVYFGAVSGLIPTSGGDACIRITDFGDEASRKMPITVRTCIDCDIEDFVYIKWANSAGGVSYWGFDEEIEKGIPQVEAQKYGVPVPDYISRKAYDSPYLGYAFPFGGAAKADVQPSRTITAKSRRLTSENCKYLSDLQRATQVWLYNYAARQWTPQIVTLDLPNWQKDTQRLFEAKITIKITDYATI